MISPDRKRMRWLGVVLLLAFPFPVGLSVANHVLEGHWTLHWSKARTDSTGLAPDPITTAQAVVQVYAARASGWRGALGVHTWIAVKPTGAHSYIRYEVLGWSVRRGYEAVRVRRGVADGYWFGSHPDLLVDLRGDGADALVQRIHEAAIQYPHMNQYRLWPGPNSNTFTAYMGRAVPQLGLELPPTAIGKDYIAGGGFAAPTPSGRGYQISLYGMLGFMAGVQEGLEINLLGLTFGIDPLGPALKLPGLGRIGFD